MAPSACRARGMRRAPTPFASGTRPTPVSFHIVVPEDKSGIELDEYLCLQFPLLNKGFLRRQVRDGRVLVDGTSAIPSQRLRRDQVISIDIDEEDAPEAPVAPACELPILYESEHLLALDKPAGLAVEPERWARQNATVSGALLSMALERAGIEPLDPLEPTDAMSFRPRVLHRLDKETSGVMLVAKTIESERLLRTAFEEREVKKTYLALVEGEHPLEDGEHDVIDLALGPDDRRSGRMRVLEHKGKPAQTRISVVERFHGFTLLRCEPLTGRTHQIRVHLAAVGFPLAVDRVYGRRKSLALSEIKRGYRPKRGQSEPALVERHTLHAHVLEFLELDGSARRVEAPLPKDLQRLLKQLRKVRPPRR